jgi:hypothetical protein
MVLVSIDPFASRRIFLIVAGLLCFSAACFADPVLMAQRYATSKSVFSSAHTAHSDQGECAEPNKLPSAKGVDLPARGLGLLPSGEPADRLLFPAASLFFSTLEPVGQASV